MELNKEEITRVFAMYIGSEFIFEHGEPEQVYGVAYGTVYDYSVDESGEGSYDIGECKLMLTPLDDITDADLKQVVGTYGVLPTTHGYLTKESSISTLRKFWNDVIEEPKHLPCYMYQFLILYNYAVPLWFSIDHKANGKTAIDLGIAIANPK
ncbi:MAG: hypothetical protein V4538_17620 [Bacteroidota bacterium]